MSESTKRGTMKLVDQKDVGTRQDEGNMSSSIKKGKVKVQVTF